MKKYNKYYLKKHPGSGMVLLKDPKSDETFTMEKDPDTGEVLVKNPEPVLGDITKSDCPLEEWHVRTLNRSWKKTGIYYALMPEKEVKEEKSEARLALEKEAKELGIQFRDNIGDVKLQEKINKAIEE